MAPRLLFWLFVTKLKKPWDNDGLPSGFLSANAASAESGDQPGGGKWFCRYCRALFDDGGRWMVMLDNNLYLVSVVWFLRRSHVDRGTRGGKVVVGTDLSKRKVGMALPAARHLCENIWEDNTRYCHSATTNLNQARPENSTLLSWRGKTEKNLESCSPPRQSVRIASKKNPDHTYPSNSIRSMLCLTHPRKLHNKGGWVSHKIQIF